jgi:dTDP-4-amino-4,6-dideoxygalactose transaminase
MIPRLRPHFKASDAVFLFGDSRNVYEDLEQHFAGLTNSKYAVVLPYGRSALYFYLKAFDINKQEVIVPAYTCQSVIGPILETENIPVFADSKAYGFNMDEGSIAPLITGNTKAIVTAAMYGSPIDLDHYIKLKTNHKDICCIGDYALGFLTYVTKQKEDALKAFDIVCFSFGIGKEVSFLGGGVLITNDEDIYRKIKEARDAACTMPDGKTLLRVLLKLFAVYLLFNPLFYKVLYLLSEKTHLLDEEKGLNIGVSENLPGDSFILPTRFQMRLALNRLENIGKYIQNRKMVLDNYYEEMKKIAGVARGRIILPAYCDTLSHFPILVPVKDRDEILRYLTKNNIHSTVIFKKTLNEFCADSGRNYRLPHAGEYAAAMVVLPLYYGIPLRTIRKVVALIGEWLKNHD